MTTACGYPSLSKLEQARYCPESGSTSGPRLWPLPYLAAQFLTHGLVFGTNWPKSKGPSSLILSCIISVVEKPLQEAEAPLPCRAPPDLPFLLLRKPLSASTSNLKGQRFPSALSLPFNTLFSSSPIPPPILSSCVAVPSPQLDPRSPSVRHFPLPSKLFMESVCDANLLRSPSSSVSSFI